MHDSMNLILYAGCLGLSPVISAKIHASNVFCHPKIEKESLKPHIFRIQGRSRLLVLVTPESSSAVLVMISCNHSHTRLVDSSRNCAF